MLSSATGTPSSVMVGTLGRAGRRAREKRARGRTRPASIMAFISSYAPKALSTCPPSSAFIESAAPL